MYDEQITSSVYEKYTTLFNVHVVGALLHTAPPFMSEIHSEAEIRMQTNMLLKMQINKMSSVIFSCTRDEWAFYCKRKHLQEFLALHLFIFVGITNT